VEVETPNVEAGVGQFISPGAAVETMSDRQGRREGAAVDIKHDLRRVRPVRIRRHVAEKQGPPLDAAVDAEMLFLRVELGG